MTIHTPNMRQKLITLCPTTFETACGMDNFSKWVRIQLQRYRDNRQTTLSEAMDSPYVPYVIQPGPKKVKE